MSDRTDTPVLEHLRDHLTDGDFHDRCPFCLHRRRHGGNGVRCGRTDCSYHSGESDTP